eukprot:TRINITY_DN31970_c0_g1_i1.p1 TRINITY_DN31970_c0_g1~~TRINITY_DN31970_c0_g1_i1.p1  ORF type:complete len:136 (+),score=20.75 TRINITY_DN31970_c0_g1_i1:29-409(+)
MCIRDSCINYGCKANNPVGAVFFYSKKAKAEAGESDTCSLQGYKLNPNQVGICLPQTFQEHWLRVYSKIDDEMVQVLIGNAWSGYCSDKANNVAELTPSKTRPTPRHQKPDQVQRSGIKRPKLGGM